MDIIQASGPRECPVHLSRGCVNIVPEGGLCLLLSNGTAWLTIQFMSPADRPVTSRVLVRNYLAVCLSPNTFVPLQLCFQIIRRRRMGLVAASPRRLI